MDRDLVYVLLLIAVVATLLVLVVAVWSARRRSAGNRPAATPVGRSDARAARALADPPSATLATTIGAESADPSPVHDDSDPEDVPELESIVDPVTGLGARLSWAEALRNEEYRFARYRHPTTVLVAELHGLDALAERLGQEAADRLIPPVADAMRRNARHADILARVTHARFYALLPETDEIAAINYVERVRAACDMWLEAGAVTVRLVIGWASPPAGGTLADALQLADERMNNARPLRGGWPVRPPSPRPFVDRRSTAAPPSSAAAPSSPSSTGPTPDGTRSYS